MGGSIPPRSPPGRNSKPTLARVMHFYSTLLMYFCPALATSARGAVNIDFDSVSARQQIALVQQRSRLMSHRETMHALRISIKIVQFK